MEVVHSRTCGGGLADATLGAGHCHDVLHAREPQPLRRATAPFPMGGGSEQPPQSDHQ
jgi:hypothetical protein